jgi:hypothetical protein
MYNNIAVTRILSVIHPIIMHNSFQLYFSLLKMYQFFKEIIFFWESYLGTLFFQVRKVLVYFVGSTHG